MQDIHWYPGHMAKAKRQLSELVRYLDLIVEVRDARIPITSHNTDLEPILGKKSVVVVLNKIDLADPEVTPKWSDWFWEHKIPMITVNGKNGNGVEKIWQIAAEQLSGKSLTRAKRIAVVGIPNVGKSSILNRLLGTGAARTGNIPGVTRGKQWIKHQDFEILDTPGLLPPKITNQTEGYKLALVGTIKDQIVDGYDLALYLMENYGVKIFENDESYPKQLTVDEQLAWFAEKRKFLVKGGGPDLNRAIGTLLHEFRNARLNRVSLESPPIESAN
ncbi:MAG: ribosome biogenesis GTPase YlqF [Firmicutes bacterium]|nr:ribosome biogenesis GTPase YlqF [Bacillota bacterium]